jgi:hypothetical protein
MGTVEGVNGLGDIIPELDKRFRYAAEGFRIWHIVFLQITIYVWSGVNLLE